MVYSTITMPEGFFLCRLLLYAASEFHLLNYMWLLQTVGAHGPWYRMFLIYPLGEINHKSE